jgi:glycerophosphoryl diester phosphodiesterase
MTLAEIRKLNIIDSEGNITSEKMPTLDEILTLVNGRTKLLIEIKRTRKIYFGIEQKLIDKITEHQAAEWVIIQSFNDSVLENIHAINPKIRLEKLIICKFPALPLIFDGSFTHFNFQKYNYISSFNIFYKAASRRLINRIHQKGYEVKIWTLNNPAKMPDIPVEGIITDRPDLWTNP